MSRASFRSKFRSNLSVLRQAVEGQIDLDHQYPKIYRKVYRYYQDAGIQLYNEPEDDYEIVLDCIAEDLESAGVY